MKSLFCIVFISALPFLLVQTHGQIIQGTIDFPLVTTCSESNTCCSFPPSSNRVPNVEIVATILQNGFSTSAVSGTIGLFQLNFSGQGGNVTVKLVPTIHSNNWLNGVSTLDLIKLNKHILRTEPILCPFSRIAGDVNNDGILNSYDATTIQQLILGHIAQFDSCRNWRFLPKNLIHNTSFLNNNHFRNLLWEEDYFFFGDTLYPAPFAATYSLAGLQFGYPAYYSLQWVDSLEYWPLQETCVDELDWGFYTFKSGDISGNANISFSPPPPPEIIENEPREDSSKAQPNTYRITAQLFSSEILEGFQAGFRIAPELREKFDFTVNNHIHGFSRQLNFSTQSQLQSEGELRLLWYNHSADAKNALSAEEPIDLFKFEIESALTKEDLQKLIYLDQGILPLEFYRQGDLNTPKQASILIDITIL